MNIYRAKPEPSQLAYVARGAEYANRVWLEWLTEIGYGVDFTCTPPPPCEPAELAEVYAETDGESVEDWTAILLDGNTAGGWYGTTPAPSTANPPQPTPGTAGGEE